MSLDELKEFNVIPRLIDLADAENFFISTLDQIYSANYYFSIENGSARGNKDLLLVSIAVQVGDEDDKEKILVFLKKCEERLRENVRDIIAHEGVNNLGIFAPENNTFIKNSLHGLFENVFEKQKFDAMFKQGQDRIAIFTQKGLDPIPVIDFFRKELLKDKRPSLRTRLVVNAMDELSFAPFHCAERGSDACLKDKCPPCSELINESAAAIYMLDSGRFNMDVDFEDMSDYLKAIDRTKQMPVLVMQVDGGSTNEGNITYEEVTAKLQDVVSRERLMIKPRHGRVPIGNTEAFKDCMSWLIKKVI
nr:hypothetical protein [Candidatus Sigynarchaeum springense]MDO8119624.1 hypothetical protein [Candidatus Sigynarchaeota archaeon]